MKTRDEYAEEAEALCYRSLLLAPDDPCVPLILAEAQVYATLATVAPVALSVTDPPRLKSVLATGGPVACDGPIIAGEGARE